MLQRLYIDNFKCMANFEFRPSAVQPIFGANGTGKTTIFDFLRGLQGLVAYGLTTDACFPTSSLTRWDIRDVQSFELDIAGNGGEYEYRLEVGHDRSGRRSRVDREALTFNGFSLFRSEVGQAELFRDGGISGPTIALDWTRSGLSLLGPRPDSTQLTWFKSWIAGLFFVDLIPPLINSHSESEQFSLDRGAVNFASWFRHVSQERMGAGIELTNALREVIDGFDSLSLAAAGENVRILKVRMITSAQRPSKIEFDFRELSDGQRALIVLYSVLHFMRDSEATLCLDEPANFVALPEIQPFLINLRDSVGQGPAQVLLISHHPEVINYMSGENAAEFIRAENGPVRVRPFDIGTDEGLTAAELVARGWQHE